MTAVRVGALLELEVGAVAHGGHCVARHEGQVVFVRHALPGERVRATVTEPGKRFLRADAVEVLQASPDRVVPPCPHAGPGGCGGCDWQHAALEAQRRLKADVLREALRHQGNLTSIGGRPLEDVVHVRPVDGDAEGLRWRTRVAYAVAAAGDQAPVGTVGLRRHRSTQAVGVRDCRIATDAVVSIGATEQVQAGTTGLLAVASSTGERVLQATPPEARRRVRADRGVRTVGVGDGARVTERAAGREWRVDVGGFWQVHPGAADVLVAAVRRLLAPRPGEQLLDLYSGVGLFAGSLAADLGPDGRIDAVEGDVGAVRNARRNLHDLPQVRLHQADVRRWLRSGASDRCDLVVLDPPRQGAGAAVTSAILSRSPRAVAYVACDPVALARDLRTATDAGWQVASIEAYDLFPMTHHLETVALLLPGQTATEPDTP